MKKTNTSRVKPFFANGFKPAPALIALTLLLAGLPPQVSGENLNPGIIPPQAHPYGKSYGEWSALWWQWAYKLPVTGHPWFDATGADAAAGQSGPVWFLCGKAGLTLLEPGHLIGVATRNITVPPGKALFFPILNWEDDNVGRDVPLTIEQLWVEIKGLQDGATNMTCEIDGRPVEGLSNGLTTPYRVQSPVFSYWLPPADNFYQFSGYDLSGTIYPAIADGVFLMLTPLSPGQHTLHFSGDLVDSANFPYLTLDITYHITVDPHAK